MNFHYYFDSDIENKAFNIVSHCIYHVGVIVQIAKLYLDAISHLPRKAEITVIRLATNGT